MIYRLASVLALLSIAQIGAAADWPQFRGPNRDDISRETGLLQSWPEAGPQLLWHIKGLGHGFSSVSVAGDQIYTLGNADNVSKMFALSRKDGKLVWSAEVGPSGGNLGCTPTVDGDRVYALGQKGDLVCLRTATDGSRVWHRNLAKDFKGARGGWDYCESPLVDGDRVVVTPGGKEATMVALDKKTGELVWKCAIPVKSPQAGYSSIVISTVGGVKQYVQLLNGGVVGVSTDGKPLWEYEKLGPNTANIPTPVVLKNEIFAAAGYGKGGVLELTASGKEVSAKEVYLNRELTNKHGGVVVVGKYAYGDTDDHGMPYCADVQTGKIQWKRGREGNGRGSASVTYADGRLYFEYDNGVVALVEASPDGYKETGSLKVETDGQAWAHPVVVGGCLYLREGNSLYCYDVRANH